MEKYTAIPQQELSGYNGGGGIVCHLPLPSEPHIGGW